MNFAAFFKALNAALVVSDAVKRITGGSPPRPPETAMTPAPSPGLAGQLETRLTNVVVAALKEAFDRDHARLELERAQLEEQRRRAEEALRAELQRQAADREVARLRLLAGTALVGWIAAVAMFAVRLDGASVASRVIVAVGWVALLGALGAAFTAQGRIGAHGGSAGVDAGPMSTAALVLLMTGLALSALSLLF